MINENVERLREYLKNDRLGFTRAIMQCEAALEHYKEGLAEVEEMLEALDSITVDSNRLSLDRQFKLPDFKKPESKLKERYGYSPSTNDLPSLASLVAIRESFMLNRDDRKYCFKCQDFNCVCGGLS